MKKFKFFLLPLPDNEVRRISWSTNSSPSISLKKKVKKKREREKEKKPRKKWRRRTWWIDDTALGKVWKVFHQIFDWRPRSPSHQVGHGDGGHRSPASNSNLFMAAEPKPKSRKAKKKSVSNPLPDADAFSLSLFLFFFLSFLEKLTISPKPENSAQKPIRYLVETYRSCLDTHERLWERQSSIHLQSFW